MMALRFWKKIAPECECFVVSPAKRAVSTADFFRESEASRTVQWITAPAIYEAPLSNLLGVVDQLPIELDCVAVFGHNPGLSLLLEYLTGQWIDLPTCAIASVTIEGQDWNAIGNEMGTLAMLDYPKREQS